MSGNKRVPRLFNLAVKKAVEDKTFDEVVCSRNEFGNLPQEITPSLIKEVAENVNFFNLKNGIDSIICLFDIPEEVLTTEEKIEIYNSIINVYANERHYDKKINTEIQIKALLYKINNEYINDNANNEKMEKIGKIMRFLIENDPNAINNDIINLNPVFYGKTESIGDIKSGFARDHLLRGITGLK